MLNLESVRACTRESENTHTWTGEGQSEGDRWCQSGSTLTAENLIWGSNSWNCEIMTWAKVRHLINWATQVPQDIHFYVWANTNPELTAKCACVEHIPRSIEKSLRIEPYISLLKSQTTPSGIGKGQPTKAERSLWKLYGQWNHHSQKMRQNL